MNTKLDLNEVEVLETNIKYLEQTLQVKELVVKSTNNDPSESGAPAEEVIPGKPIITFSCEKKQA